MLLRVLQIIQKLLQENRHVSKRDIYYMHPYVFLGNQPIYLISSNNKLLQIDDLVSLLSLAIGLLLISEDNKLYPAVMLLS